MISFIIPVYNTEKYIRKCIESILEQNLSNYEIIIVDDGSTDNSLAVCKEFAARESNIHVDTQVNSGPSAARNRGIELAKGEFIFFIDSDDYYINGVLARFEKFIENNPGTDLVFGKIMSFHESTFKEEPKLNYKYIKKINNMNLTGEEALIFQIKTNQVMISNYSCLIKRKLLIDNNIRFNEKIFFGEDVEFMLRVYYCSKNIHFIDEFFLMYRRNREGQLTRIINYEKLKMAITLYADLIYEIDGWDLGEHNKKMLKRYLSNLYFSSLGSLKKNDVEFSKKYDLLYKYRHLIKYVRGYKFLFSKCIYKLFGFNTTVQSMQFLKSLYHIFK